MQARAALTFVAVLGLGLTRAFGVSDNYAGGVFNLDYGIQAIDANGAPETAAAGFAGTSSETANSAKYDVTATGNFLTLKSNQDPAVVGLTAVASISATPLVSAAPIIFTNTGVAALTNVGNPGSNSDVGLFLRGSGTNGYLYNLDLKNGTTDIASLTGGVATTLISVVFGGPFNAALSYYLEFTAVGSTLTGNLYSDESRATLLRTLTFTDSTYASGYAGMYASFNNDVFAGRAAALGTFDDFLLGSSIPEPASLGLVAAGGLLMLRRRRA